MNKLINGFSEELVIIKRALNKEKQQLSDDYWRFRVLKPYFGEIEHFPNAVKNHFCPLFWLSNIFPLIWCLVGFRMIGEYLDNRRAVKCLKALESEEREEEAKRIRKENEEFQSWKNAVFGLNYGDVLNFKAWDAERYFKKILREGKSGQPYDEIVFKFMRNSFPEFDWKNPTEEELKHFYKNRSHVAGTIFGLKKKETEEKSWESVMDDIMVEYEKGINTEINARLEQRKLEREKEEAKLAKIEANKKKKKIVQEPTPEKIRETNLMVVKLVEKSKFIFKWGSILALILVVISMFKMIAAAFFTVVAGVKYIGYAGLVTVGFLWDNVTIIILSFAALGLTALFIVGLCHAFEALSPVFKRVNDSFGDIFSTMGDMFETVLDYVAKGIFYVCYPFVLVAKMPFQVVRFSYRFVIDFIKMMYTENCPAIEVVKKVDK